MSSEVSVGLTDLYFSVHGDHIMIYNPVWTRIALLSVNIITPRYGGGVYRRTRFVSWRRGRWQRRRRRRRGSALIILFRSVISAAAAAQSQPLRSSRDFFPAPLSRSVRFLRRNEHGYDRESSRSWPVSQQVQPFIMHENLLRVQGRGLN